MTATKKTLHITSFGMRVRTLTCGSIERAADFREGFSRGVMLNFPEIATPHIDNDNLAHSDVVVGPIRTLCVQTWGLHVHFWPLADIEHCTAYVRFRV